MLLSDRRSAGAVKVLIDLTGVESLSRTPANEKQKALHVSLTPANGNLAAVAVPRKGLTDSPIRPRRSLKKGRERPSSSLTDSLKQELSSCRNASESVKDSLKREHSGRRDTPERPRGLPRTGGQHVERPKPRKTGFGSVQGVSEAFPGGREARFVESLRVPCAPAGHGGPKPSKTGFRPGVPRRRMLPGARFRPGVGGSRVSARKRPKCLFLQCFAVGRAFLEPGRSVSRFGKSQPRGQ